MLMEGCLRMTVAASVDWAPHARGRVHQLSLQTLHSEKSTPALTSYRPLDGLRLPCGDQLLFCPKSLHISA
jgi:hypothetical protein